MARGREFSLFTRIRAEQAGAVAAIRRVTGSITGRFARLNAAASMTRRRLGSLGRGIGVLGRGIGLLTGVGLGGLTAGLGAVTRGHAAAADEIAKFSRQVGLSAEALQTWEFVAERQGVGVSDLRRGLGHLTRQMGDLRAGSGTLSALLDRVSPALKRQLLAAGDTEAQFRLLLDAMRLLPDPARRAALAAAAFGRGGLRMTRIAAAGADEIAAMRREAERLGIVSTAAAEDAEIFADATGDLSIAMRGLRTAIGTHLVPVLTPLVQRTTDWLAVNRELVGLRVGDTVREIGTALRGVDWPSVVEGMRVALSVLREMLGVLGTLGRAAKSVAPVLRSIVPWSVAGDAIRSAGEARDRLFGGGAGDGGGARPRGFAGGAGSTALRDAAAARVAAQSVGVGGELVVRFKDAPPGTRIESVRADHPRVPVRGFVGRRPLLTGVY